MIISYAVQRMSCSSAKTHKICTLKNVDFICKVHYIIFTFVNLMENETGVN